MQIALSQCIFLFHFTMFRAGHFSHITIAQWFEKAPVVKEQPHNSYYQVVSVFALLAFENNKQLT